jgi:hypothetical protein
MLLNGGFMHKDKLFDKRIINRNVKKKFISQKDVESNKKELEDDNSRLEVIKIDDDIVDDMPTTEDYK